MRRAAEWLVVLAVGLTGLVAMPLGALELVGLYGLTQSAWVSLQGAPGAGGAPSPDAAGPAAREALDERAEFNRICGQVQVAAALSEEQVRRLIEDCEALLARLRQSSDPQSKVLVKRLEMCREFFEFTLEARRLPPD